MFDRAQLMEQEEAVHLPKSSQIATQTYVQQPAQPAAGAAIQLRTSGKLNARQVRQLQARSGNQMVGRFLQGRVSGLPERLKQGVEAFSGLPMDDVRVHYNSPKPAELQALAYTQGNQIYVGPGQEQHLPHEAWHVVQQKSGRVKPTIRLGNLPVNDAPNLETEADRMGNQAAEFLPARRLDTAVIHTLSDQTMQRRASLFGVTTPLQQHNKPLQFVRDRVVKDKKIKFNPKAIVKTGAKIKKKSMKVLNQSLDEDMSVTLTGKSRMDEGANWLEYKNPIEKDAYWAKESDIAQAQFEPVSADIPLFPSGDPTLEDVKQGELGDCYLLAALATLVNRNAAFVKGMIKEDVDKNRVSVRFYSRGSSFWVTVEKTVVRMDGEDLFAQDALWVQMVEKAYVAAGFSDKSIIGYKYEDIEAGLGDVALQNLTGKKSERKMNISSLLDDEQFGDVPWGEAEEKRYKEAKKSQNYSGLISWQIFGDKTAIDKWMTQVVKPGHIKNLIQDFEKGDGYQHQIRLEDFQAMFSKHISLEETTRIISWMAEKQLFPGKRLTGKYSKPQLELFHQAVQDINQGILVTVASNPKIARPDPKRAAGTGHSGGEQTAKGLVGGHEYALVGYWDSSANPPKGYWAGSERDSDGPSNPEFNYVQLYNPWGKYSRSYDEQLGTIPKGTAIRKESNGKLSAEELAPGLASETTVVLTQQVEQDSKSNSNWQRFWSEKQKKYYWAPQGVFTNIKRGAASKPSGGGRFWLELSDFTKRFRRYSRIKAAI
jgi:hypothetical protein